MRRPASSAEIAAPANAGRSVSEKGPVSDYQFITYEELDQGSIVRIMLNRPETRNAQNRGLLVELNHAFLRAEEDDGVRVVILGGVGPLFSSGHDLGSADHLAELDGPLQHPSRRVNGGTRDGTEKRMLQEWHHFFQNTRRWRDLRKITVAQVQGRVFAAGLMLAWACDFIVAGEDVEFADVVGTRLGMCGVEYFAHPWELGPRRAKELLLTGDSLAVDEAYQIGMVSKVFPNHRLNEDTLGFARRIAQLPTMTSLLIKESVNQSVDNMGFHNALNACFTLHELNHAHWAEISGGRVALGTPEYGLSDWKTTGRPKVRDKRTP
jgi:enoyl-CoA hydratase